MKLIFDHHLSPRLVRRLADLFPDSTHVWLESLHEAEDLDIWRFARENGFAIATKDSDFSDLSALRGFPPKVLRLRIGNCKTAEIEALIRRHADAIHDFEADDDSGLLENKVTRN